MKFDFTNSHGEKLAGRLEMPTVKPVAFAIFAHCFTCTKDIIAASTIARTLTAQGIGVLRFDFTGLGNSQGDFSNTNFSSNVQDLVAAYEAIAEAYQKPQLVIGHSLGGAAVLKAATLLPEVKAVVTIGAPSSVEHVSHLFEDSKEEIAAKGEAEVNLAGRQFKIKKQFLDDISGADVLTGVKSFSKALLVMHSPTDNTVSIDHAANIFIAAKHPKSFVSLDGADHLLLNKKDAAYAAEVIGSWVSRYLDIKTAAPQVSSGQVVVQSRPGALFTQDIYTKDHHLVADEPKSIKGDNLGMTPYDLLLAGLGACTSMTMGMYARRKEIPLEGVQVSLLHRKIHADDCTDCETTEGMIDQIEKKIEVTGDINQQQQQKLLEIAEKCPVNKTLKSEIKVRQVDDFQK